MASEARQREARQRGTADDHHQSGLEGEIGKCRQCDRRDGLRRASSFSMPNMRSEESVMASTSVSPEASASR
jgi:hypothetical protein